MNIAEEDFEFVREAMTCYTKKSMTVLVLENKDENGNGQLMVLGTGNFYEIAKDSFRVITCEHVHREANGRNIGYSYHDSDKFCKCLSPDILEGYPIDVCTMPAGAGARPPSASNFGCLDDTYNPVEGEILYWLGCPGTTASRNPIIPHLQTVRHSYFDQLDYVYVPCAMTEYVDSTDGIQGYDSRFHSLVNYPTKAKRYARSPDVEVVNAKGMSGSFLWDTKYVAMKKQGRQWEPGLARICGILHGVWEKPEVIIVTKVEHFASIIQSPN